jgi:hypothetical protein
LVPAQPRIRWVTQLNNRLLNLPEKLLPEPEILLSGIDQLIR